MSGKPHLRSPRDCRRVLLCGLGMGAADLVPGFSGGMVAFLTGIYPDLIASIVSFNAKAFRLLLTLRLPSFFHLVAWEFLLVLGLGIGISIGSLSRVIQYILGDPILRTYLFAGFIGLVLASVTICIRHVPEWRWPQLFVLLCAGCFAFWITSLPVSQSYDGPSYDVDLPRDQIAKGGKSDALVNYDFKTQRLLGVPEGTLVAMLSKGVVTENTLAFNRSLEREGVVQDFIQKQPIRNFNPWLFFCGMLAIAAFLLPGMSGSYMLAIVGAYPIIIGAMADFVNGLVQLSFNVDAFWTLANLGLGIIVGLLAFSRVASWLLHHYRTMTVAAIIGFMVGALRAVWPFWTYEYFLMPLRLQDGPQLEKVIPVLPDITSSLLWISLGVALVGFAAVMTLESMTRHHKSLQD